MIGVGRRRTIEMKKGLYNGPARRGPVRHVSLATLSLQAIYEQDRSNWTKVTQPTHVRPHAIMATPNAAAKGKPRLLLMGQKRYVFALAVIL